VSRTEFIVPLFRWYQSAPGPAHFEDGTVNFLNLPAVEIGLRFLDQIGMDAIHRRVQALTALLLDTLGSLRHPNDSPAACIYGPRTTDERGATVGFNFLHPDGRIVDERFVDRVAREHMISLRTGCFCNPGAGEVAFTISRETLVGGEFGEGMTLDDYVDAIGLPSGGAVRASLGLASNQRDISRFDTFAGEFLDLDAVPTDLPTRAVC
jgi:selenocysteine lyase/cysteine desulfurase